MSSSSNENSGKAGPSTSTKKKRKFSYSQQNHGDNTQSSSGSMFPSRFLQNPMQSLSALCTLAGQLSERIHWGESSMSEAKGARPLELFAALQNMGTPTPTTTTAIIAPNNPVFVPRSFKGASFDPLSSVIVSEESSKDIEENEDSSAIHHHNSSSSAGSVSSLSSSHSQPPIILRPVCKSVYERVFDEFMFASNDHDVETMLTNFRNATRPDVITSAKYWNRQDLFQSLKDDFIDQNTSTNSRGNAMSPFLASPAANPFGFQDLIEVTGYQMDTLKSIMNNLFAIMPDSVMWQRSDVKVIDQHNGVIRSIASMSMIGTAVLHTSTKDLHEIMPYIPSSHPALQNPQSKQPTLAGSLVSGISSLLSNIPLSITLDVGLEVDGYIIAHFDTNCNKIFRLEYHYFRAQTNPFSMPNDPQNHTSK